MSEAPMTGAERRHLLRMRDENAGLRLHLAILTEIADGLEASQRRELDQPEVQGAVRSHGLTADKTSSVPVGGQTPAVKSPPVAQPVENPALAERVFDV